MTFCEQEAARYAERGETYTFEDECEAFSFIYDQVCDELTSGGCTTFLEYSNKVLDLFSRALQAVGGTACGVEDHEGVHSRWVEAAQREQSAYAETNRRLILTEVVRLGMRLEDLSPEFLSRLDRLRTTAWEEHQTHDPVEFQRLMKTAYGGQKSDWIEVYPSFYTRWHWSNTCVDGGWRDAFQGLVLVSWFLQARQTSLLVLHDMYLRLFGEKIRYELQAKEARESGAHEAPLAVPDALITAKGRITSSLSAIRHEVDLISDQLLALSDKPWLER